MTTERYEQIVAFLRQTTESTPWEGHVYTVGGCCRDMMLGEKIHDIDLAVTLPDGGVRLAEWLRKEKLTAGEPVYFRKYGTARLFLKKFPRIEIELVQTRSEKYTDRNSRNPETAFGSIEDDCLRRDLTINSLYQNVATGKILDLSGRGLADLRAHVIRTPMEPDATFDDDPVRILRAIRFAAKYGWDIDAETLEAMRRHCNRLSIISAERLYGEFEKLLLSPRPAMALELLRQAGAIPLLIPELCATFDMTQSSYHFGTVWQHTLAAVEGVSADPVLRMAALLHDIGKTVSRQTHPDGSVRFPRHDRLCRKLIATILARFKCRKPFVDKVIFLCANHEAAKSWGDKAADMSNTDLRRLMHKCGTQQRLEALLALIDADNRAYAPDHCMPRQVKHIRKRIYALRDKDKGVSMFSYHLPLKPSRIARIAGTREPGQIERLQDWLMQKAYADPLLTREQMAEMLRDFIARPGKPGDKKED